MSMNLTITTYQELSRWVEAFLRPDGLNLLFLVGSPGCGKSAAFKARLNKAEHHYLKASRLTAFQLFKQLYKFRHKAIILDDVEDVLKRSDTARLLMALCETEEQARMIAWFGTESLLRTRKGQKGVIIPQEFETTSRVCVICNDWNILTSRFGALLDRGTTVFFDPPVEEIHRFVGEWFVDNEIYDYIGKHRSEIPQHSIRYYVLAHDQKRLGLDWRSVLQESWTNFKNEKERIKAFTEHPDGGSRRTWFNRKKKLTG
jgi:hypothetical protein